MDETQSQVSEQAAKSSMSPAILVGIVLLLVVGGGVYFLSSHPAEQKKQVEAAKTQAASPAPTVAPTSDSAEKVFTVKGTSFAFDPNQITVKKGDKVKIIFQDDGGFHDLVIDGYNVKTQRIMTGNSSTVEFTADKSGTFAFYCSVANHREKGMQGTLTVE